MKRRSLTRVVDKLIDGAMAQFVLCNGSRTQRNIKEHGYANLSERFKPGRMIMAMDPEDRELLKEAKGEHFNHRQFI